MELFNIMFFLLNNFKNFFYKGFVGRVFFTLGYLLEYNISENMNKKRVREYTFFFILGG